jgi:hypothetical protein
MMGLTLQQAALLETSRAMRTGRWFSLLRIAPVGWSALQSELEVLANLISAHLRHTDLVENRETREIGVLLYDTVGAQVLAPVERVRTAAQSHLPKLEVRIGWATVGPGQRRTWQEGWRWAGQLLVADAAIPAAA